MTAQLVVSLMMVLLEVWWIAAFVHAYRQLRDRRLLLQVGQGLLLLLFFALLALNAYQERPGVSVAQLVPPLLSLVLVGIWQTSGGAALLRERYLNRLADVLRFRRPSVNMRRRVRSK